MAAESPASAESAQALTFAHHKTVRFQGDFLDMKNLIAVLTAATMAATAHAEPLEYAHSFFGHVGAEKVGLAISIQGGEILVGIPHWGSPGPKKATLYNAATGDVIRTFDAPVDRWYGDFGRRVVLGANQVLVCGDSYGDGSNEDRPIFIYDRSSGEVTTRIPNPHADQWNGTGFGDDCDFDDRERSWHPNKHPRHWSAPSTGRK